MGCIAHSLDITGMYLRYDMKAEYRLVPRDQISTPAITLCFRLPFREKFPRNSCPYLGTSRIFRENALSYTHIIDHMTVLFPTGMFLTYENNFLEVLFNATTTAYRYNDKICYNMAISKLAKNLSYNRTLFEHFVLPVIVKIKLDSNHSIRTETYLNADNEYVSGIDGMFSGFEENTDNTYSYKKLTLNLMAAPYKTKCRKYSLDNIGSQDECYKSCKIRHFIKEKNRIPKNVPYSEISDIKYIAMTEDISNTDKMVPVCHQQCLQPDCNIIIFSHVLMQSISVSSGRILSIALSSEPELDITYIENTSLIEFITLMGSIFGLWLGLSISSLAHFLK
ncbi:hypothetical protein HDE_05612 [Halotydeus destructor]|nr:hypothetical protein HDE_05612 [Halotydeus destructor]